MYFKKLRCCEKSGEIPVVVGWEAALVHNKNVTQLIDRVVASLNVRPDNFLLFIPISSRNNLLRKWIVYTFQLFDLSHLTERITITYQ